jgi:hypothetical protein
MNDTRHQLESLVCFSSHEQEEIVMVDSLKMYAMISEIGASYKEGKEVDINTKYKTVDHKIKPVAAPLPTDSHQRLKEVSMDPKLQSFKNIGHKFTKETRKKLRVCGGDLLLPEEERQFLEILERHGEGGFCFLT